MNLTARITTAAFYHWGSLLYLVPGFSKATVPHLAWDSIAEAVAKLTHYVMKLTQPALWQAWEQSQH